MPLRRAKNKKFANYNYDGGSINISHLQAAVRSRRWLFRTLRFAVYPVSHINFASVFRKLPFRISQITHSPIIRDSERL